MEKSHYLSYYKDGSKIEKSVDKRTKTSQFLKNFGNQGINSL